MTQTFEWGPLTAVFGATGVQGGAMVRTLGASGWPVRALGRDPDELAALAGPNVETRRLVGFAEDEVAAALAGLEAAFVCLPLASGFRGESLIEATRSVCAALRREGVGRVVWTASWVATRSGRAVSPFFDALREAAELVLALPQPALVLEPAGYLENLLTSDLRAGVAAGRLSYLLPTAFRYRWVGSDDQARIARAALGSPHMPRGRRGIGQAVTGEELAAAASEGLGWTVR